MKNNLNLILMVLITALFTTNLFQNCSKVDFSKAPDVPGVGGLGAPTDPAGVVPGFGNESDPGLRGGHFDLDTSKLVYAFGAGDTSKHIHEYDDKHNINYADFFNLIDAGYDEVDTTVGPSEEFIIIVGNANLSPGGVIEINGVKYSVIDYTKMAPVAYSLDGHVGTVKLSSFKAIFAFDVLLNGLLVPTVTGCVQDNKMGVNGEYRDGALTFQILKKSIARIDPVTKTATPDGGLLWEATVFWHRDSVCY